VNGKKVDYAKFFVFSIGTGEVIRGWETIVVGGGDMTPMRVGSKRKAMIPPELAYGAKGAGCGGDGVCRIPPGSTLEFTIELVGIV
jgi:peptidylprolyl isomerase